MRHILPRSSGGRTAPETLRNLELSKRSFARVELAVACVEVAVVRVEMAVWGFRNSSKSISKVTRTNSSTLFETIASKQPSSCFETGHVQEIAVFNG